MEILPLKCETCGATLERPTRDSTVSCTYCGAHYMLEKHGSEYVATQIDDQQANNLNDIAALARIKRLEEQLRIVRGEYDIRRLELVKDKTVWSEESVDPDLDT